jgi:hypothetical protein
MCQIAESHCQSEDVMGFNSRVFGICCITWHRHSKVFPLSQLKLQPCFPLLSSKKIQNFGSRKPRRHFIFAIKEKRAVGKIFRFEFHIWHALMLVQIYEAPKKKKLRMFSSSACLASSHAFMTLIPPMHGRGWLQIPGMYLCLSTNDSHYN